jgi:hypothetical protein
MNKYDTHDALLKRRTFGLFDDFAYYVSTDLWTTVADGATVAASALEGGILTLTGDTTLNDEVNVATTLACFKFVSSNPLMCELFVQYSEANTNKMNFGFGFTSAGGSADMLVDTTGEPAASFSGAIIYKVPGGTQWKTCSSLGSTQTKNQSDTTAGGTAYQRLQIVVEPVSSTIAEVTYYVDGIQLKTTGGRPGTTLIKDQLTYTSAVVMNLWFGLKQGSTTAEAAAVDYAAAEQLRATFTGF